MNIVVLLAGENKDFFDAGYTYPKNLIEIDGMPLIQRVLEQLKPLLDKKAKVHVVLRKEENQKFFTGTTVKLLIPEANVIETNEKTGGAACTALLAVDHIDNNEPLVIINGDIILDYDLSKAISDFEKKDFDGGIITFESVHPRWSYVRCVDGLVVEASEKRPISNMATVGVYYFKRGSDFVDGAENMILKDDNVNGIYYVCPTYNQMILNQAKVGVHPIKRHSYHSLSSLADVKNYEKTIQTSA